MKHKMWSRLLSVALALMMIASIVPNSAFAETASGITGTSQMQAAEIPAEMTETTQEQAAVSEEQTPASEAPVESVAPTAEPMAEPSEEPAQTPEATAVPGEQPGNESTAAPGEQPEATAAPEVVATPAPSANPLPSEAPAPGETPEAGEETVRLNENAYEETAAVEGAAVTVTVDVPAGALPQGAQLKTGLIAEDSEEYTRVEQALEDDTLNEQPLEYDGMIALNIRFELEGQEVEPLREVQVTIDARALLPEETDPETVAVQHLKEDEAGKVIAVETVADATEETGDVTVEQAQAQEAAMDVASTFAVDGFSSFTITWSENHFVTVYYVSSEGDQLEKTHQDVTIKDGEYNVDLKQYSKDTEIAGYRFAGEYCLNYGPAENAYGVQARYIRYNADEKKWQYKESNYTLWQEWILPEGLTERRAFLVYEERENAAPVETVSTRGEIKINLFDYDADYMGRGMSRDNPLDNDNSGVNTGHTLKFKTYATGLTDLVHPNYWTGLSGQPEGDQGGVLQGIVQNTLQGGYPVLKNNNAWNAPRPAGVEQYNGSVWVRNTFGWNPKNESLGYLFNDADVSGKVESVLGADYLFQKNADGYYYYDSSRNSAVLNVSNKKFTVYNKANSAGFNPFADSWDQSLNEFFGMTVETNFIMPKAGKLNGQDMVFEFSGDDDVWVFVDDVLLLDMGGIHAEVSGSINFAKQQVTIEQVNSNARNRSEKKTCTFEQLFAGTGKSWDDTAYKGHTLKFFYLERGGNVSNCKIQFNLPVVPENSLMVTKTLDSSGNEDLDQYLAGLLTYRFRVVDAENTNTVRIGEGTHYDIYKNGSDTTRDGTVGPNGVFTLKKDETAVFANAFQATARPYMVQELVPDGAEGQFKGIKYEINGSGGQTTTTEQDDILIGEDKFTGYSSGSIDPAQLSNRGTASVTFNNEVTTSKEQLSVLKISKELEDNAKPANDTFVMEVRINGELLPEKTEYLVTDAEQTQGKAAQVNNQGQILLKAGQTATLLMLAGNNFSVKELSVHADSYQFVQYKLNDRIQDNLQNDPVTGTMMTQAQTVTVVNRRLKGDVTITKTIKGSENLKQDELVRIRNGLKFTLMSGNAEKGHVESSDTGFVWKWDSVSGNWVGTYTFYNMEDGNYTVRESAGDTTPQDLTLTVKIDKVPVQLNDGVYSSTEKNLTGAQSVSFDFENTYAPANGTLKISKLLQNDQGSTVAALGGGKDVFSFRIDKMENGQIVQTWYMHVNGEGSATVDGEQNTLFLPSGQYTVTELNNINYTFAGVKATKDGVSLEDDNVRDQSITVAVGDNQTTQVTFINMPGEKPGITDGSGVINRFTQDSNGNITITGVPVDQEGGSDDAAVTENLASGE